MQWSWGPLHALSPAELYAMLALRQAVFVVEQDCAYLDADGKDLGAFHLLGRRAGELVACARVLPPGLGGAEAAIGRVVVAPHARGTGLGRALMVEALDRTRVELGPGPVFVSAQAHLQAFYASLGFAVCGEGYLEDGIPHLPMRKSRNDDIGIR